MANQIQIRRDTAANWTSINPILAEGELGLEKETGKIKIGDGLNSWRSLGYNNGGGGGTWGSITGTLANQADLINALNGKVSTATTVNGHALSSNVTLTASDVGLGNVPNVNATNPANISQDSTHRFVVDTEKNTWNGKQDALGFTPVPNTRNINGHPLSADVTIAKADVDLSNVTNDAQLKAAAGDFAAFPEKTLPVSADLLLIEDSAAGGTKKKVQISNLPGGASLPSQTGHSGQYLTTNGTSPSWGSPMGTGNVVGPASANDSEIAAFDGTDGKKLKGTGIKLGSGITGFTKGSLLAGTGNNTPDNLPVGASGQFLVVDNTQSTGVKWTDPAISLITNLQTTLDSKADVTLDSALADGEYDGPTRTLVARVDINAGQLVMPYSDSGVLKATLASHSGDMAAWFIAVESKAAGNSIKLLPSGRYRNDTKFNFASVGGELFRDPTTDGELTITKPTTSGNKLQKLGFVEDAHTIFFNPSPSVGTVA